MSAEKLNQSRLQKVERLEAPRVVSSKEIADYVVSSTGSAPRLNANWADGVWAAAEVLEVAQFRSESSDHRPKTHARLLYDDAGIHGIFQVQDRFVRCVRTAYQSEVWKDSCAEFFVQPKANGGYFNFEFNCGGAFLCFYIVNPERTDNGFKEYTRVPAEIGQTVQVRSSLPARIDPEIAEPITWTLQFFIPWTVFEHYVGPLGRHGDQVWRGNFFKCAEEVSHPHWATWSPVDAFNFHLPRCFGTLRFLAAP
jgi:hypothetical protein